MTDDAESLDLFADSQYVYGEASLNGEIEVVQLPESLDEPVVQAIAPLQIDRQLENALHHRLDDAVEITDTAIQQDCDGQLAFIDVDEWWKIEWQDMPEYRQDNAPPFKSLNIHFLTRDDMTMFAEIIGQKLTSETRAIWYPQMHRKTLMNLFYVDESIS